MLALLSVIFAIYWILLINAKWQADIVYATRKSFFPSDSVIQQAIALSPHEPTYHDGLTKAYVQNHKVTLAQAVQATAQHLQNQGSIDNLPEPLMEQLATSENFLKQAVGSAEKTLELNPHHISFYKTYFSTLTELTKQDPQYSKSAIEIAKQTQELAPTDPSFVLTQALFELEQESTQSAILSFKKAIEMKPNYEEAYWQLAQIYEKNEEYENALFYYQALLENAAPHNTLAQEKVASLSAQLAR